MGNCCHYHGSFKLDEANGVDKWGGWLRCKWWRGTHTGAGEREDPGSRLPCVPAAVPGSPAGTPVLKGGRPKTSVLARLKFLWFWGVCLFCLRKWPFPKRVLYAKVQLIYDVIIHFKIFHFCSIAYSKCIAFYLFIKHYVLSITLKLYIVKFINFRIKFIG